MKQRLGLANTLLMPRELLVLDEPTNGLDPQGTREVRALIRSLADSGTTVFVSSHLLAEIEQICTHVGVMSAGALVATGTLDELRQVGAARVILQTPDAADARRVLSGLGLALLDQTEPTTSRHPSSRESAATVSGLSDVVAALVAAGVRVRGFSVEQPSLEDRFVALTGRGVRRCRRVGASCSRNCASCSPAGAPSPCWWPWLPSPSSSPSPSGCRRRREPVAVRPFSTRSPRTACSWESRHSSSPSRCSCRSPSASSPATPSRARPASEPCATCSSPRRAARGCSS